MAATGEEAEQVYRFSWLCNRCQAIFVGEEPTIDNKRQHHDSILQMKLAAQIGCHLCTITIHNFNLTKDGTKELQSVYRKTERPLEEYSIAVHIEKGVYHIFLTLAFSFNYHVLDEDDTESFKMTNVVLQLRKVSPSEPQQPGISSNTASNTTISRALNWVLDCTTHHRHCNSAKVASESHLRPSRLLDLKSTTSLKSMARLIEAVDIPSRAEYTTLSHCWGTYQPTKLTTSSLQRLKDGITASELSQTFQDAITVTKRLGMQYIWIDCLCILQDSVPDWQYESARMGDVYANAHCNIAASASSDGRGGLFRDHNPLLLDSCLIKLVWNGQKVQTCSTCTSLDPLSSIREVEPLCRRGWVVQERLLSPRILHFGEFGVLYECSEGIYSESPRKGWKGQEPGCQRLLHPLEENELPEMIPGETRHQRWCEIVRIYSGCALTFETDRLVAISAVARNLQATINSDYLAGLWRTNFECQLLWAVYPPSIRPSVYIVPSWSWASISGSQVHFSYTWRRQVLIKILEVKTISTTEDKMAELVGGHLKLSCFMTSARCLPKDHGFKHNLDLWADEDTTVSIPCIVAMDTLEYVKWNKDLMYCVPVLHNLRGSRLYGLLLVKRKKEGFRRCGRFILRSQWHDKFWESCINFGNTGAFETQPYLAIPTYEQTGDPSQHLPRRTNRIYEEPSSPQNPYPLRDNIIQRTITIY